MRLLMDDIFRDDLDQHLWIPPSLPYYGDSDANGARTSKALVFASWSMVPDAVAAVLSYEAERRMGVKKAGMGYFDRRRPRPLQFRLAPGPPRRPSGSASDLPLAADSGSVRPA